VFRNEGVDRDHHPEFTSCEFYMAHADYRELFSLTEEFFSEICGPSFPLTTPFKRVDVVPALEEALRERCGRHIDVMSFLADNKSAHLQSVLEEAKIEMQRPATTEQMLNTLISELVESQCVEPTFLVHHPTLLSPLAKARPDEPLLAERFELFIGGREICNAYSELNDPVEQRSRFEKQRRSEQESALESGSEYCRVLEYGLPPTAGWGIGVDRLVMLLAGSDSIRDVLLYPVNRQLKESTET
jgi:lysyl-tRNA synthetase class 2